MHSYIKFGEILSIYSQHNERKRYSGVNQYVQKMTCNNPNLAFVNINAYIKFGEILSFFSQDIDRKEILGLIKGHNSGTRVRKLTCNNLNLDRLYKNW